MDTAASASDQQLAAAVHTVGADHVVHGSDWGVPCTDRESAVRGIDALDRSRVLSAPTRAAVRARARVLFPAAAARAQR